MQITHRIPWSTPYGYTEVQSDGGLTNEEITNVMFETAAMEESYRTTYELPKIGDSPMTDEVIRQGGRPQPRREAPAVPQMGGQDEQAEQFWCRKCNGPAVINPKSRGMKSKYAPYNMQYPAECQSGCKNDKGYPLATWVEA